MVYKKYVKKGGKTFGPYYCESYRDKDGKVKTRFISGPEGAKIYEKHSEPGFSFKMGRKKNFFDFFSWSRRVKNSNFVKNFRIEKPQWLGSETIKKSLFLIFVIFLGVLLILGLGFVLTNSNFNLNWRATGFAIEQNITAGEMENLEMIVENYDTNSIDLSVKEPIKSGLFEKAITKNKNKRMDFDINGKNLRLYFDLLNYSEFVEGVAETNLINVMQNKESEVSSNVTKDDNITNESESIVNATEQANIIGPVINATINESVINESKEASEPEKAKQINNITEEAQEPVDELVQDETNEQTPAQAGEQINNESIPAGIMGYFIRFFGLVGRVIGLGEENLTFVNFTQDNESVQNPVVNETPAADNLTPNNQTSLADNTVNFDINDVKQTAENLSEAKIDEIADNSVVSAENFDIKVNSSKINDAKPEYKWGYKIKLNDLKFMARIDITSDEQISVHNENTLKIGRSLLSFDDLVKAGYKVRIENPALEIPFNISLKIPFARNITFINETIEKIINETIVNETIVNITEVNVTEINQSEINITETNVTLQNQTIINETITNITEINITEPVVNVTEPIVNETTEGIVINNTEESGGGGSGESSGGNKQEEKTEEKQNKEEAKEKEKETGKEQKQEKKTEEKETKEEKKEEAPAEQPVSETPVEIITGGVVKFLKLTGKIITGTGKVVFGTGKAIASSVADVTEGIVGFAGRVVGIEENATVIEDIKYANTYTIYIERDFNDVINVMQNESGEQVSGSESLEAGKDYEDMDGDGKISMGDIINLDPTLIIIPISNAEELDSSRNYIRNIYNETSALDDNYVLINNSNFVRATFKEALGKDNDITVFARLFGYSCNESVVENCSEIIINETTNETQQVCENQTIENCPEINESEKGKIEIYKENGNDVIAKIENITKADYYKTYLDGLHGGIGLNENESYDVFDLKIINAESVLVNNSVVINGQEVAYDIYQKKKRIDEIQKILFQNFLSVQFLILFAFLPKLNIRRLLNQS